MKYFITLLSFLILFGMGLFAQQSSVYNYDIHPDKAYQEIHSFGASDSWRVQFVGENWPLEKRNHIADLLFSLENDKKGNPKGIGLSVWRFYLGAGTKEQGDSSNIANEWRRSPSFLDAQGHYDWTKYKGQRWFLNAAQQRGVDQFLMYTISPPVFYTKNGKGHASKDNRGFNLKPGKYDDYARYIVDVLEHFKKQENFHFDYISPFNEPQWDWEESGQEGTPAYNEELYVYMKHLAQILDDRGLSTQIVPGEAATIAHLFKDVNNDSRGDQINVFYNPQSPLYIGDFPNMKYAISSHSYFTTWPLKLQIESRQKLAERFREINPGLDYWQTEFCILEESDEIGGGRPRDLGMPTALYVARVIHSDLTIAQAKTWEWWTALSQFDYKDGLIHLDDGKSRGVQDPTGELNEALKYDGHVTETKLLWALGNYSRFVRPGMVRVDIQGDHGMSLLEQATDLQVSAYKDPESGRMVLVFLNHDKQDKQVRVNGLDAEYETASLYVTDETRDLEKSAINLDDLQIPKRSVTTLVLE